MATAMHLPITVAPKTSFSAVALSVMPSSGSSASYWFPVGPSDPEVLEGPLSPF